MIIRGRFIGDAPYLPAYLNGNHFHGLVRFLTEISSEVHLVSIVDSFPRLSLTKTQQTEQLLDTATLFFIQLVYPKERRGEL